MLIFARFPGVSYRLRIGTCVAFVERRVGVQLFASWGKNGTAAMM
jgi:hypothetical protein